MTEINWQYFFETLLPNIEEIDDINALIDLQMKMLGIIQGFLRFDHDDYEPLEPPQKKFKNSGAENVYLQQQANQNMNQSATLYMSPNNQQPNHVPLHQSNFVRRSSRLSALQRSNSTQTNNNTSASYSEIPQFVGENLAFDNLPTNYRNEI